MLATWFAPDPVKVATFEVDPTSSGLFNVIMQMPGHDPTVAPAGCVLVAYKDARLVRTAALGLGCGPNPPHDTAGDFYLTVDLTMTAEDGDYRDTVKAMHATPAGVQAPEKISFF